MKYGLLILLCCVRFGLAQHFICTGTVSDSLGPIPFAGIWCAESHTGVVANEAGQFNIALPFESKTLQFRALGYATQTVTIHSTTPALHVLLRAESYTLQEIEILSGEDPAVYIIKNALQQQTKHLNQTSTYKCNTYIKGLQRIHRIPKNASRLAADQFFKR